MLSLPLVLAALAATSPAASPAASDPAALAVRALVEQGRLSTLRWPRLADVRLPLQAFYAARGFAPAWTLFGRPSPQARALAAALSGAREKGLDPADYGGDDLLLAAVRLDGAAAGPAEAAAFDVAMTVSVMRYAATLRHGRVDPRRLGHALDTGRKALDLPAVAAGLAAADDPLARLAALEPRLPPYQRLLDALARMRSLAPSLAALPPVPAPRRAPRPGEPYPAAGPVAERLVKLGDLGLADLEPARAGVYTEALSAAVARFQHRHALEEDGLLGRATVAAMNVPAAARVRQLELALERWRWMPDFELPALVVNVAEARLVALEERDGRVERALTMDVIVGDEFEVRRTPVFARRLDHLVFRPYWEVPRALLFRELVPRWARNPAYFAERGFFVEAPEGRLRVTAESLERVRAGEARVRQLPGPENAMGGAKFMFPNEYSVYLHGTNEPRLFERADRALSNGCVRVPDVARLAEFVLAGQPGWDAERIAAAIAAEEPTWVRLERRPWVFIVYATAYADREGALHFFRDVYGHDARLERALRRGYPSPDSGRVYQARTRPSSTWTKSLEG